MAFSIATVIFKGIFVNQISDLLIASVLFGLINIFIKQIILFTKLQDNYITLIFVTIILNAILLTIADLILDGLVILGFLPAAGTVLVVSLVSIILYLLKKEK